MNELTKRQKIALEMLSGTLSLISLNEDRKIEFIDNALKFADLFIDISEYGNEKNMDDMKKMYMNPETGSVDDYDGWNYKTEDGQSVNAVDLGEVVEVEKNEDGDWIEVE